MKIREFGPHRDTSLSVKIFAVIVLNLVINNLSLTSGLCEAATSHCQVKRLVLDKTNIKLHLNMYVANTNRGSFA